jgi:hypothetical protein
MPFDLHGKARRLFDEQLVVTLSPGDELWLRNHLADCPECQKHAMVTTEVLNQLTSISLELDAEMNGRVKSALAAHMHRASAGKEIRAPLRRYVSIAAAALILVVAIPAYRNLRGRQQAESARADALLLQRIDERVARVVPLAMEPLVGGNR